MCQAGLLGRSEVSSDNRYPQLGEVEEIMKVHCIEL